jgi:superfamily II DNA helicase RecQ
MTKRGGRCQSMLWPNRKFTSKLQRIVFDEAHCIVQWGSSFRPVYKEVPNVRFHLPNIPVYLSSATMPPSMITQLKEMFCLDERNTIVFQRSNDRPNIAMAVRRMEHPQASYEDLAFLVPKGWKYGDFPPKKFMVFFNNKKEAEAASKFLQARVSQELRQKLPWFHAGMSKFFRIEEVENLRGVTGDGNEIWGFEATDSGGLVSLGLFVSYQVVFLPVKKGLDIPDISIVVLWRVPDSLNTIVQRFGRAVRNYALQGVAILIAEPSWFYEEQIRLQQMRKQRQKKRKSIQTVSLQSPKRKKTHTSSIAAILSPSSRTNHLGMSCYCPYQASLS